MNIFDRWQYEFGSDEWVKEAQARVDDAINAYTRMVTRFIECEPGEAHDVLRELRRCEGHVFEAKFIRESIVDARRLGRGVDPVTLTQEEVRALSMQIRDDLAEAFGLRGKP